MTGRARAFLFQFCLQVNNKKQPQDIHYDRDQCIKAKHTKFSLVPRHSKIQPMKFKSFTYFVRYIHSLHIRKINRHSALHITVITCGGECGKCLGIRRSSQRTLIWESFHLSASNRGLSDSNLISTHSAPDLVETELQSSFSHSNLMGAIHQSETTVGAVVNMGRIWICAMVSKERSHCSDTYVPWQRTAAWCSGEQVDMLVEQSSKFVSFPVQLNPTSEGTPSLLNTDGSRASAPVAYNNITQGHPIVWVPGYGMSKVQCFLNHILWISNSLIFMFNFCASSIMSHSVLKW